MTIAKNWIILAYMDNLPTSEVFFNRVDPSTSPWPYLVSAGGHSFVSAKDGMVSRSYHEHTLILTLAGQGRVKVGNRHFDAKPGSIVWLDTSKKYAHGAGHGANWRYLWVGLSGYGLDRFHAQIGLAEHPVIEDESGLKRHFEEIVQMLAEQRPTTDAALSALIGQIAAALFGARHGAFAEGGSDPISKLMRQLRKNIAYNWDIAGMAAIAGLGQSQLFRAFSQASGTTPMQWLRQERMHLARHLLTATSDSVASIAERCGYADPYHFSRDFKRLNGSAPRLFRTDSGNSLPAKQG